MLFVTVERLASDQSAADHRSDRVHWDPYRRNRGRTRRGAAERIGFGDDASHQSTSVSRLHHVSRCCRAGNIGPAALPLISESR